MRCGYVRGCPQTSAGTASGRYSEPVQSLRPRLGWVSWLLVVSATALAAESPPEIARKSREQGSLNLLDRKAELKLTSTTKDGTRKEQVLTSMARRIDGRLHSMSRFTAPPSAAGVAVLTVEGAAGEGASVALYLPKLRRVRKVAASQRGESFMQTDFSYADLAGTGAVRDEQMKREADEVVEGRRTFVLTGRPGEESPYRDVRVWIDQETYVPLRASYTDRDGKPFKTYRALKLKRSAERTFAAEAVMENLQKGTSTRLEVLRLDPSNAGDDAFTERALERG